METQTMTISLDTSPMTVFLSLVSALIEKMPDADKEKLANDLQMVLSSAELAEIEPGGGVGAYRAVPSQAASEWLSKHASQ